MNILKRRPALVVASAAIVGALLGGASPAFAGAAYSTVGSFTVNGISYTNQAFVVTASGTVSAYTSISAGVSVGAGWMGARARLFNASGALVQESQTAYSSMSGTLFAIPTTRTGSSTWNSYGVTYSWTGSGYSPYYTFRSPNQTS